MKIIDRFHLSCLVVTGLLLLCTGFTGQAISQSIGDYRTVASGPWSSSGTWQWYDGSSWVQPAAPPTASANSISISPGDTVHITSDLSIDQLSVAFGAVLIVDAGQIFTLSNGPGTDLDLAGTLIFRGTWAVDTLATWKVESGGTYIHNTLSPPTAALDVVSIDPASTFEYLDAGAPAISGRTYGNLRLSTSATSEITNSSGTGALTVNGSLIIGQGVRWILTTGFTGRLATNGDVEVNGTWVLGKNDTVRPGKSFIITGMLRDTLNGITIGGEGNFTLASGATIETEHPSGIDGLVSVTGTRTLSTGATYEFGAQGPQVAGILMPATIGTLTVNSPGGLSLSRPTTVEKMLRLRTGIFQNTPVNVTMAPGSMIRRELGTLTMEPGFTGQVDLAYVGPGGISTGPELPTDPAVLQKLSINMPGGVILSTPVTVNRQLDLDGGVFDNHSQVLTINDSSVIDRRAGVLGAPPVFLGAVSLWYAGSEPVITGNEVPSSVNTLWHLTINNTGGVTLGTDVMIHGVLSLLNGTLHAGSSTISLLGTWNPFILTGGSFDPGSGTVQYYGTTATNITPVTYNVLELRNPVVYTGMGDFHVGDLIVAPGATFIPGGTISGSGQLTVNGTVEVLASSFYGDYDGFAGINLNAGSMVRYQGSALQHIAPLAYHHLLLLNSSGAVLDGPVTVRGFLTLGYGNLDLGSYEATLYNRLGGTITNLTGGPWSSLRFEGTGESIVIPPSISGLQNLTINNPNGVSLTANVMVTGAVTILNGRLRTTSLDTVFLGPIATLSESGHGNIVFGRISATRTVSSAVREQFGGIGFELTPASAPYPGITTVTRTTGTDLCGGPGSCSIKRYYTVSASIISGMNLSIIFHYGDEADELVGREEQKLYLFRSPTGTIPWIDAGFTFRDTAANTVMLTGASDLSTWTASDSAHRLARPSSWTSDCIAVPGSEPNTISSLINDHSPLTAGNGIQVWQIDVRDGGNSSPDLDSLPTILTSLTIGAGFGNTVPDWTGAIRSADLFAGSTRLAGGTVSRNTIQFTDFSYPTPDNTIRRLSLRISLRNPLATGITDHQQFMFSVENSGVTSGSLAASSQFAGFPAFTSTAGRDSISVAGTRLLFTAEPPSVHPSRVDFSVAVSGADVNGNIDRDYDRPVTLTAISGSGVFSSVSGLTKQAVEGTSAWSDLRYSIPDSNIRISASDGVLLPDTSLPMRISEYVSSSSDIIASGGEADSIPSITNDPSPLSPHTGIRVWRLTLRDGGASHNDEDSLPTILTRLSFVAGDSNTVADWKAVISAVDLFQDTVHIATGTILADTIRFEGFTATAPDNGDASLSVRLSLNDTLPENSDHRRIAFLIQSSGLSVVGNSRSSLLDPATPAAASSPSANVIAVTATRLVFISPVLTTTLYTAFSAAVATVDIHNNIDKDYSGIVTFSKASGPGDLSGTTACPAVQGVASSTDLTMNVPGTYSLLASAPSLASSISNYFTIEGGSATIWYVVKSRWNMISVPLKVPDFRVSTLFPTASSRAFTYNSKYVKKDTLDQCVGYWLKFSASESLAISGEAHSTDSVALHQGWNMIGSLSAPVPVGAIGSSVPNLVMSRYFAYNGKYVAVDTILPMQGYWVKASGEGILRLMVSQMHPTAPGLPARQYNDYLTVIDASGNSQVLSIGASLEGGKVPVAIGLPPVPPEEAFDARFADDRSAIPWPDHSGDKATTAIRIQTASYPVRLQWHISSARGYDLVLFSRDNKGFRWVLRDEGEALITEEMSSGLCLGLVPAAVVPTEISCSQNFPNPFNPSTTLNFAIPGNLRVRMIVYDLIGRTVRTLLDDNLTAGYHTISWDGRDNSGTLLPSGIYFVRMTTDHYQVVRKMVMLR